MDEKQILEAIASMTNREAADILRQFAIRIAPGRCNGKYTQTLAYRVALTRAIWALEAMSDKEESNEQL